MLDRIFPRYWHAPKIYNGRDAAFDSDSNILWLSVIYCTQLSTKFCLKRMLRGVPDAAYPGESNTLLGLELFIDATEDVLPPNKMSVLIKWHQEERFSFG